MTDIPSSSYICVGRIVGVHGVRGQVKLRSYMAVPDSIKTIELLDEEGQHFPITIVGSKHNSDIFYAQLEGVDDRNQAEELRGTKLFIERSQLPSAEEDEFYISDLVGLTVCDTKGNKIGVASAFHNFGAGDIIEVTLGDSKHTELFPFNDDVISSVNLDTKVIKIDIPDIVVAKE